MKKLLFLLALLTTTVFGQNRPERHRPGDDRFAEVSVFPSPNFQGRPETYREGNYASINLRGGFGSLRVPRGFVVEAFAQPNFRGPSTRFSQDVARLEGWSGRIRSFRVVRDNDRPGFPDRPGQGNPGRPGDDVVVLFEDDNFRGSTASLTVGRHTSVSLGALRGQASSIRVPRGYTVQVFGNDRFSGPSYTFTESSDRLRNQNWNDRIFSVIVKRR